jgi:predicted DNA-binding transcriptional regulator YafY
MSDAWGRRLKLLAYLMRRGFAQTADAARYVGVERRKVRDDLEALAAHGVPLSAIPEDDPRDPDRTWQLERSWRMTGLEVRLLERLALLLGKEVLEPLLGGSDLGTAMAHLEHELASVAGGVETPDGELLRRFYLVQEPSKGYADRGPIVSDLVAAIAFPYRITVDYRSPRANLRRHERIRPLTLAIYRRGLYVFVQFDSDRIGALSVDRIETLQPHPEADFDYPIRSKWDPANFLRKRFGLFPGEARPEQVRLRFPAGSRTFALERQWMPDQVVEERDDGGVDVVFEAEGAELAHRVLEWGGYCEVVAPASLRAKVLSLAEAVVARHRD